MFHHMADAMRADIDDPLSKWLLVTLCDYANDEGICWPSTFTLAHKTGMSRATVARKLNLLEDAGYIRRQELGKVYKVLVSQSETAVSQADTPPVSQCDTKLLRTNTTKRKRGVPEDWYPSDALIATLNTKHNEEFDHGHEASIFRDHHRAKGNKFADIDAAYRNWVARSIKFRTNQSSGTFSGSKRPSGGNTQSDRFGAYLDSITKS